MFVSVSKYVVYVLSMCSIVYVCVYEDLKVWDVIFGLREAPQVLNENPGWAYVYSGVGIRTGGVRCKVVLVLYGKREREREREGSSVIV